MRDLSIWTVDSGFWTSIGTLEYTKDADSGTACSCGSEVLGGPIGCDCLSSSKALINLGDLIARIPGLGSLLILYLLPIVT